MSYLLAAVLTLLVGTVAAHAQPDFLALEPPSLPLPLLKLLAGASNFTAEIEIFIGPTNDQRQATPLKGRLAVRDGAVRFAPNPPRRGMSGGPFTLYLPQAHARYLVIEAIEGYAATPMADWMALTVETTEVAREKWKGRAVVKSRCVVGPATYALPASLLWTAPDLSGWPVRWETQEPGTNMVIVLKAHQPYRQTSVADFRLPDGLRSYPSESALVGEMLGRMAALMPKVPFGARPPGGFPGGPPPGGGPPGGGPPGGGPPR